MWNTVDIFEDKLFIEKIKPGITEQERGIVEKEGIPSINVDE